MNCHNYFNRVNNRKLMRRSPRLDVKVRVSSYSFYIYCEPCFAITLNASTYTLNVFKKERKKEN